MDKENNYRISCDDSKGYLIVSHKKEHKCIICGESSKFGNSRSSKKGKFDNFICSDCLESFIHQYSKSTKKMSLNRFIKGKVSLKRKLDKAPDIKCRLCGAVIKLPKWRGHLRYCHDIEKSPKFYHFFIRADTNAHDVQKKWYNPDYSNSNSVPCGTKINGGPKVSLIYNAVCTNRRKH